MPGKEIQINAAERPDIICLVNLSVWSLCDFRGAVPWRPTKPIGPVLLMDLGGWKRVRVKSTVVTLFFTRGAKQRMFCGLISSCRPRFWLSIGDTRTGRTVRRSSVVSMDFWKGGKISWHCTAKHIPRPSRISFLSDLCLLFSLPNLFNTALNQHQRHKA